MGEPDSDENFQNSDQLLDDFKKFVLNHPKLKNNEDYLFVQKEIPSVYIEIFDQFFHTIWKGTGLFKNQLKELGMSPKGKLIENYLGGEEDLLKSTCDLFLCMIGVRNSNDRVLYRKILQNNLSLRNFYDLCQSIGTNSDDNWSLDVQALIDFPGQCFNVSSLFHFCLNARHAACINLSETHTQFFREYTTQIMYYQELGVKSDLMITRNVVTENCTEVQKSDDCSDIGSNTSCIRNIFTDFNQFETNSNISDINNEYITTPQLGNVNIYNYEVELPEPTGPIDYEKNVVPTDKGEAYAQKERPETPSNLVELGDMNLDTLNSDNLLEPLGTKGELQAPSNRFVGMVSSRRFGSNTYKSMLEGSNLASMDIKSSNGTNGALSKKVSPSTNDEAKLALVPRSPMEEPNMGTQTIKDFTERGMGDSNPLVRAHIFSLGEACHKLDEFLTNLRLKEEEAKLLGNPTKASDSILKETKAEWQELSKEVDSAIQGSIKDDVDRNQEVLGLKDTCVRIKKLCKESMSNLVGRLSLNIGLHSDAKQWEVSLRSLPKGMLIGSYSNPSIFCYMVSFINLLNQNPVDRSIYMPSLYNALNEKNSSIMASIRVNYNPQDYKELFKVIIGKFCGVPSTLQTLLSKMDSIGQMRNPTTFHGFIEELDKSNKYQGLFNFVDSWIKILSTFYTDGVGNWILQGPHSSSMIAKMKACFIAEKVSGRLLHLSALSPADQFHELIDMFTTQHHSLQQYVNELKHTSQALSPRANPSDGGAIKKSNNRFREVNNLTNTRNKDHAVSGSGPRSSKPFDFDNGEGLNSSLGKAFDLMVRGGWDEKDIPSTLKEVNGSTTNQLIDAGIEENLAGMIAKLILVPCKICIQYCTINAKNINQKKTYLVPHFSLMDKAEGIWLSKRLCNCPTFLALDSFERNKVRKVLDICRTCTYPSRETHTCIKANVCCRDDKTHFLFCTCQTCVASINRIRRKWMDLQSKYISTEGMKVLLNGGHLNANHVRVLTANFANLAIPSVEELRERLNLDISVDKRVSRFSLVHVRGQDMTDHCFILDSGASTSTITAQGIQNFYHTILDSRVTLKTATGETSLHKEAVAALTLKNGRKHLAVSFLIVEHDFDAVESINVTETSDNLYARYVQDCLSKRIEMKYTRNHFPNVLPRSKPIGLLGVRDFQLNVIASDNGVIALSNIFDSHITVILTGPLPVAKNINCVNVAYAIFPVNHEQGQLNIGTRSINDSNMERSKVSTKDLKERIAKWLDHRDKRRSLKIPARPVARRVQLVRPIPRADRLFWRRGNKDLEDAVKIFGNHLSRYMTYTQMRALFLRLAPMIIRTIEEYMRGSRIVCPCEDPYCLHCLIQSILLSGDVEENPGPSIRHLSEEWDGPLGFKGVMLDVSSEGFLCLFRSVGTFFPFGSAANPSRSAQQLKQMLGQYVSDDFVRILRKANELEDFKEGVMERKTSGGLYNIKSLQSYRNLFSTIFHMERTEIIGLSEILQVCFKIWLSPNDVEYIGDRSNCSINLFLDLNAYHFSPIIRFNGKIHQNELRRLGERFNQTHLNMDGRSYTPSDEEFPPLPKASRLFPNEGGPSIFIRGKEDQSKVGINDEPKGEIITISPSSSESDPSDVSRPDTWTQVRKKTKRKSRGRQHCPDQPERGERTKNQSSHKGGPISINWNGLQGRNPFQELRWEGGIDRTSYGASLPRRTLITPNYPEQGTVKETHPGGIMVEKEEKPTVNSLICTKKENSNYFIGIKISGAKTLSNVDELRNLFTLKDPSLTHSFLEPKHLYLNLLSFKMDESDKSGLKKVKKTIDKVLEEYYEFEIHLNEVRYHEDTDFYITSSEDRHLEEIYKKLYDGFSANNLECEEVFRPHLTIVKGCNLPTKDMLRWACSLGEVSSTEFVDKIELIQMGHVEDHYRTKHTYRLKEINGSVEAYLAQNKDNTSKVTDYNQPPEGDVDEPGSIEVGNNRLDICRKVSHLLDPSQREKKRFISVHAEVDSTTAAKLGELKKDIQRSCESLERYVVEGNYIGFIFSTKTSEHKFEVDDLMILTKLKPFYLDDFVPEKQEGILYLTLKDEERLYELEQMAESINLSLVKCCIPIVQNINQFITPLVLGLKMGVQQLHEERIPITIQHLLVYHYDTTENIERYITCIGTPDRHNVHDMSMNEIWSLVQDLEIPRNRFPSTNFVMTIGDFLHVFNGEYFDRFDFSLGCRKSLLKRLKEKLSALGALTACTICGDKTDERHVVGHMMVKHGLRMPHEVTGSVLQNNYCSDCHDNPDRTLHMFQCHNNEPTVGNCFLFIGKIIQFGKIRQDIGDLFLIPEGEKHANQLSMSGRDSYKTVGIPLENQDMEYKGVHFNYPARALKWRNRSLASTYLVFLVIFRFIGKLLSKRGKNPRYTTMSIESMDNFRLFCPILKNATTFIEFSHIGDNPLTTPSKIRTYQNDGGERLTDMREDKNRASHVKFFIERSREKEDFSYFQDCCKAYPHVIPLTGKVVRLARQISNDQSVGELDEKAVVNEMVVTSAYLVGFLTYGKESNRKISQLIMNEVLNSLALCILTGKGDLVKQTCHEIRMKLKEGKPCEGGDLLESLPKTRLRDIAEHFLPLNELYFNPDPCEGVPNPTSISALHIFPDVETYQKTVEATDIFLLVRSNLEVQTQDGKMVGKWLKQNCVKRDGLLVAKNRISGNGTLTEKLIDRLDRIGIAHDLIPLHPDSPIFRWCFIAAHRNHIRVIARPNNRKQEHLGIPLTLQNFTRAFSINSQNRIISSSIDKCVSCKLRRSKFKKGHVGDFYEESIDYQDIAGGMFQIDIIPDIKLAPHSGTSTRGKGIIKIGAIICVDRFSRYTMVEPLRSRNAIDVIQSLESIFAKHGMPRVLLSDQESSLVALAKAEGWPMSGAGFLFSKTCELTCVFTPSTSAGHSRNGVTERAILSIKKALGGTDFTMAKIDLLSFNQIINNLASRINNLPIATKATGSTGPGLENLMTPEILFKGLRFHPICLPKLKTGTEEHILKQNMILTQNILATFVIEHFSKRRAIQKGEDSEVFEENTIVAFHMLGSSRSFQRCYDTLKIGEIVRLTDYEGNKPRSAIVKFVTLCGTPVTKSKAKIFASKRKLSELIYLFLEEDNLEDVLIEEEDMIKELPGENKLLTEVMHLCRTKLDPNCNDEFGNEVEVGDLEELLAVEDQRLKVMEQEIQARQPSICSHEDPPTSDDDEEVSVDNRDEDARLRAGIFHIMSYHGDTVFGEDDEEGKVEMSKVREVLRQLTTSDFCSVSKCPSCDQCFRCKNIAELTASEALDRKLAAEEPVLMDCIKLARPAENDPSKEISPLRVVCRIPLDPQKAHLLGNNESSVKKEFDRKFSKLSKEERSQFHEAFQGMVAKGVFAKLQDTPKELQAMINNHPNRNFISLAPSFKDSSVQTKVRCCINASRVNASGVSLNGITYKGRNDLDLPRSFRRFRAFPFAMCSDISKFYNGTVLDVESIPFQLLAYRTGCNLDAPWETYVICKLTFGIASAAFLSSAALNLIVQFFRTKCRCFKHSTNTYQSIGGMDIEELNKIEAGFAQFDREDIPFTPGNPECNSIFHVAANFILSSFVDDMLVSLETDVRTTLMQATDYMLNFFNFFTKGGNYSNQDSDPDSETLTNGSLGVAGYNYFPEQDVMMLKPLQLHNGVNFRGRVRPAKGTKKFFFEKLDSDEKRTFEYIKELFTSSGTTPTIRLLVSRSASFFDIAGLASPLKNQIIRLLSTLLIMSKQDWNYKVSEDGFDLFLRMLTELSIASSYSFPRFPKQCIKSKVVSTTLVWLSDASPAGSLKSDFFLGYVCADGTTGSHLIHSGSKLSTPGLTVPRCEIDSMSGGSETFYKIYLEFQNAITRVVVGTDSRCVLFWALDENGKKDIFVKNRCDNLVGTLSKLPPKVYPSDLPDFDPQQGWRNLLFWFSNDEHIMTTDLGTKYILYGEKSGAPLIEAKKIGPTSNHFLGPSWLQENKLKELWDDGLCRSAAFFQRNSKEFLELRQEGDQNLKTESKENSLTDKEVTILSDDGKLKKMLAFLADTLVTETTTTKPLPSSEPREQEVGSTSRNNSEVPCIAAGRGKLPYTLISIITFMMLFHFAFSGDVPLRRLTAMNCMGDKKIFDLTSVKGCNEREFSSYGHGAWVNRSFLHRPTRLLVKSTSCTVRIEISRALCGKLNNLNRLMGVTRSMSAFVNEANEYKIINPDKCILAQQTGRLELNLGVDKLILSEIKGPDSQYEFYLGQSDLDLSDGVVKCKPVSSRVYMNSTHPYELMGQNIVRAKITVEIHRDDNQYFSREDILLTANGDKISMMEMFSHRNITPYLPTIVDEKSTVIYFFDEDYRRHKTFMFDHPEHRVMLHQSVNSSLPDLMEITVSSEDNKRVTAAIQVSNTLLNDSYVLDQPDIGHIDECFETQYPSLIVCNDPNVLSLDLPKSPISLGAFLQSRDGGSDSFLQKNVDTSVQGILMSLCLQTANRMKMIARDFTKMGGLVDVIKGETAHASRRLGELGELQACEVTVVEAKAFRNNDENEVICCKFLPVTYKNQTKFLEPISRRLTDVCTVEKCDSDIASTRLYMALDGGVIRQSAVGIVDVNMTKINKLNPAEGLDIFRLKPMKIEEHRKASDLDDFVKIKLDFAEEMLEGLVVEVTNMMQMASFETPWGIKLAKDILPKFVFFLITNFYGQLLLLAIVGYEVIRFCLTILSALFTVIDFVRRKPSNKLEFLLNTTTANRKENFQNQKCIEDIQSKIISDIIDIQAAIRFHDRRISHVMERFRAQNRNYGGREYMPLGGFIQTAESLDDHLLAN